MKKDTEKEKSNNWFKSAQKHKICAQLVDPSFRKIRVLYKRCQRFMLSGGGI